MVERIQATPEEIESERLENLREPGDLNGSPAPGSFYCHEALHMTAFLMNSVESELMQHPSITADPAWFKTAHEALNALYHLYQQIGDKHLSAEDPNA